MTVPHASCPPRSDKKAWRSTGDHACDFFGPKGGRALRDALVRAAGEEAVAELEADVPRTTLDMNRYWSRGSPWRNRVAEALADRDGGVECLLDAHSFPADHAPFFGSDVVLMTETEQVAWQTELARAIEGGRKRDFKCGQVVDPRTTDIIQDAHERGVPAVLIEFSEGLTDARLDEVAQRIADYVVAHRKVLTTNTAPDRDPRPFEVGGARDGGREWGRPPSHSFARDLFLTRLGDLCERGAPEPPWPWPPVDPSTLSPCDSMEHLMTIACVAEQWQPHGSSEEDHVEYYQRSNPLRSLLQMCPPDSLALNPWETTPAEEFIEKHLRGCSSSAPRRISPLACICTKNIRPAMHACGFLGLVSATDFSRVDGKVPVDAVSCYLAGVAARAHSRGEVRPDDFVPETDVQRHYGLTVQTMRKYGVQPVANRGSSGASYRKCVVEDLAIIVKGLKC